MISIRPAFFSFKIFPRSNACLPNKTLIKPPKIINQTEISLHASALRKASNGNLSLLIKAIN